ncbi:MAG: conserved rane protein of unknown function [Frankiales bacterium]|nr:conserved rane protein of unknown function [Frankiales bacterium]
MAMRPEMPSIRVSRRGKIVIGVLISLFILISLLGSVARVYTDWLWFGEVHYRGVYTSIFWTRIVLFLIFGLVLAVLVGANVFLAYRMRPPFRPISQEQENLERYRVALEPRKRPIFIGLLLVLFVGAGAAAQSNWKTWQLWRFGQSFNVDDPQFHRDISFFAWDYPAYRVLLGFGFNVVIFSLILSLAVHYVFGAFRIATPGPKLTLSARRHITLLVFFFIVLKACAYWLDRYGLVFSDRGKTTGASYTDVHATLPAKTILFWVAVLIALAVLASLWLKSAMIATVSFAVLLVLSIGINGIYPALVQQISVKPNASDKEQPYISRNIAATRAAYDIQTSTDGGHVSYADYGSGTQSAPSILNTDKATVPNIRITDPNVVSPTFTNAQQLRNYYGFADKLDIDRYTVNGTTSDYIVGARELKAANLTGTQTNWINKHTVFTHGYGFVAAAADKDVNQRADFAEGNIPVTGFLKIDKPQIYYGELGVDYSIVGATGTRENDASDARTSYQGSGGVSLGSIVNRLAFAVKYRQGNFVLNDAVSAKGAKVIFNRDPRQRVQQVAPFLQVDGDPYPAVINGRIVWMLDGYTTMANYPYSERQSLGNLTTDSLSTSNRTAAQPNSQINYIRNSVKATVDAYDGTVTLYQWDTADPVLKTWMKIFPGIVKPKSDIPQGVLDHIRYPQDMFEVQRSLLQRYHVTDPVQFYNGTDQWTVPDDPTASSAVDQPPYYVLAGANAGSGSAEYQLTSPMKVNNRPNMAAFISVNSQAGTDYGKFTVLRLPSGTSIQGPQQIYSRFNSEPAISSDLSLLRTGGSNIIEGNLLSLPIGGTFLYVEPLYVQGSTGNSFPLLQRVLVSYGDLIGYGTSVSDAISRLSPAGQVPSLRTGQIPSTSPPSGSPPTSSAPPTGSASPSTVTPVPSDINAILTQLDAALKSLQNAYKSGDFQKIGNAQAEVQRLSNLYLAQRSASSSSTPNKSTPKSSASPSSSPS